jgi:hypothetical protein
MDQALHYTSATTNALSLCAREIARAVTTRCNPRRSAMLQQLTGTGRKRLNRLDSYDRYLDHLMGIASSGKCSADRNGHDVETQPIAIPQIWIRPHEHTAVRARLIAIGT